MKKTKNLLIIDCYALGHYVKFQTRKLTFKGVNTGVIYGFLRALLKWGEEIAPYSIAFAWDSDKSNRKEMFPKYKQREPKSIEEERLNQIAHYQFDALRSSILPEIGFTNQFHAEGFEADDIIARLVKKYSGRFSAIYILSRDADLWQLLEPGVFMLDHQSGAIFGEEDFEEKFPGLTPVDWITVKAIAGCTSDTVPGVDGVGEKKVTDFLNGNMNPKTKTYKKIEEFCLKSIRFERNLDLVMLPFKGTPHFTLKADTVNAQKWYQVCESWNLKSLISKKSISRFMKCFSSDRYKISSESVYK